MVPPRDVLTHVEGVEKWLRRNRHLRGATWVGLVVALIQFLAQLPVILDSGLRRDAEWFQENWIAVTSMGLLFLVAVLFVLSRTWLKESREPFRYTCSVAEFELVPPIPDPSFEIGSYLRYDLTERMNHRIARLSFLDEDAVEQGGRDGRSHIHISGQLLVRQNAKGEWMVEATPHIRMGTKSAPERLGHAVKFKLGALTGAVPDARTFKRSLVAANQLAGRSLVPGEYEKVLERIYFSISSELYKQIRQDVETKIRLLPTRRLRAIAYLHEAEDYLRSNTLDAYEEARTLFDASLSLFDPRQRRAHRPMYLHWIRAAIVGASTAGHVTRQISSRAFPRLGKGEVLTARADVGYAVSLVDRRVLAGLSGHRMNAIFPARPAVKRALTRLARTSNRTVGSTETRFSAFVTKALIAHYMGDVKGTKAALQDASAVDPRRAETDARYLFASGLNEIRPRWALPHLRRAVEQDPRLEIAQFEFAVKMEYAWRMRPELEPGVADSLVVTEYEDVLKLNPGNIRAWANLGYVHWLLGPERHPQVLEAYWRGREYKEMRKTTQVAELDHGLARVYAEGGDFNAAYLHCLRAVAGRLSLGLDHGSETSAQFYFFDFIGRSMLNRFDAFLEKVKDHANDAALLKRNGVTERVRDAVVAFALNDCAEAHRDFYARSGEPEHLEKAHELFDEAARCNEQAVMPRFNRYLLRCHDITRGSLSVLSQDKAKSGLEALQKAYDEVNDIVREVSNLERGWPDAACARMLASTRVIDRVWREVLNLRALRKDRSGARGRRGRVERPTQVPEHLAQLERALIALAAKAAKAIERDASAVLGSGEEVVLGDEHSAVGDEQSTVRRLTPHDWLWGKKGFSWKSLNRKYTQDDRWEHEVDDFHLRAIFSWAAAQMIPEREDVDERARVETRIRRYHTARLLMHIRERFWPGDFLLLRLCGYNKDSDRDRSDLQAVVGRWLVEDPTARWALETAWSEKWRKEDLFSRKQKQAFFDQAKAAPDRLDPVLEWIARREAELLGEPRMESEATDKTVSVDVPEKAEVTPPD